MLKMLIAAPASGSGKTAVTCGMLELMNRKGLSPCAFKCGPDYIDPMFHRSVLNVDSHNLDLFLSDESCVRSLFDRYQKGHEAAVCEGGMGFYDGLGGTTAYASAWHVAKTLGLPVILVMRPKGASLTLAAQIKGLASFENEAEKSLAGVHVESVIENGQNGTLTGTNTIESPRKESMIESGRDTESEQQNDKCLSGGRIAGVILNDCSAMLYQSLAPMLEKNTGIPVLGYLPHMEEAAFESRHLGLHTAGEIKDLKERIGRIADQMEESIDFARLEEICKKTYLPAMEEKAFGNDHLPMDGQKQSSKVRIAVARDEAFCFFYEEGIDTLRDAGADIIWFSPLHDRALPADVDGLYLTGGYPELYVKELSENETMRQSVKQAVDGGMPTIAECGGFLYLGKTLGDSDGTMYPQADVLPGSAVKKKRLVRFGYAHLTPKEDSMLFRRGEAVPIHEFHYWDSTQNGTALHAEKPISGRSWDCGFVSDTMYAGFPHLYFTGNPKLAERFLAAADRYKTLRDSRPLG